MRSGLCLLTIATWRDNAPVQSLGKSSSASKSTRIYQDPLRDHHVRVRRQQKEQSDIIASLYPCQLVHKIEYIGLWVSTRLNVSGLDFGILCSLLDRCRLRHPFNILETPQPATTISNSPSPDNLLLCLDLSGSTQTSTMSSKLIPSNPEKVMVIRDLVPRTITTLSVPFQRLGKIKIGGRGTIGKYKTSSHPQINLLSKNQSACRTDP